MNNLLEKIKNLTQYGPAAAAATAAAAGSSSGASAAGIGSTVASGVAGGIGLISSIGNIIQNYKAREQNQANWRETFNYQKELNNILMNREDTSIQRRAADLEAAGINPMLAGLGGASATPGGIINPLTQTANPIDASGAIQGLTSMSGALGELEKIKSTEKLAADETEAQLELQRRELEQRNISDDKKYSAEKGIQVLKDINQLIRDRMNAAEEAEQRKLDRDLQWKIATHKALRGLFEGSEVPFLDQIWKGILDFMNEDDIENLKNGKTKDGIFNKIKNWWEKAWGKEETGPNGEKIYEDEKGRYYYSGKGGGLTKRNKIYIYQSEKNDKGGGRKF